MADKIQGRGGWTRRQSLSLGAAMVGAAAMPIAMPRWALADEKPPLGTWPEGSKGDTVYIGATVPRTGAYAAQGEDELKGMQLAVEHMNSGHDLMKQIAAPGPISAL